LPGGALKKPLFFLKKCMPVVRFPLRRNLNQKCQSKILKEMLADIFKESRDIITCDSMGAAIPAALNESS
jgi:hypothetical protein